MTGLLNIGNASGSKGTYKLSNSGQLSAPSEYIGNSGRGTFTQSGGTNTVGNLAIAQNSGSFGTYSLDGGLLNLSALQQGLGSAAFNFSGGTIQAAVDLSTNMRILLETSGSNGTFDSNGHTLTLNGELSGPGGFQTVGAGTVTVTNFNSYVGDTTVSAGTLQIPSGNLPAANEYVATTGTASVSSSRGGTCPAGHRVLHVGDHQ